MAGPEQLRPRGQHDSVALGILITVVLLFGFWVPLDRLGRMVLQIPDSTRDLALTRKTTDIERQQGIRLDQFQDILE